MTGTLGTCKSNGGRTSAKSTGKKKRFSHDDRIEKQFGPVTEYIISYPKCTKIKSKHLIKLAI